VTKLPDLPSGKKER